MGVESGWGAADAEVEGGGDSAAAEHPFAGDGLFKAGGAPGKSSGGGGETAGDPQAEVGFAGGVFTGEFALAAAERADEPAEREEAPREGGGGEGEEALGQQQEVTRPHRTPR